MNTTESDYIFKFLIIGDSSVGKSNLLLRFSDNIFHDTFLPTIGVDFKIRNIVQDGNNIKLNIWDTAGQERFKTITAAYYKGAHGIIIVYDITDRESFNNISSWIFEIRKHSGPNVIKLLVGNKCDMEVDRKVSREEAQSFADSQNMKYLETSAKEKINVDESFMLLSKQVLEIQPSNSVAESKQNVQLRNEKANPTDSCCN